MRKAIDILITSSAVVTVFVLSLLLLSSCSTIDFEKKSFEVSGDFSILTIDADTEQINILPAADGICKVVCTDSSKQYHSVEEVDGALEIKSVDERRWFEKISFLEERSITVYLPRDIYTSLFIDSHTGDIVIAEGCTFEHINVNLSTGDVRCRASANNVIGINTSTGDIDLSNSAAASFELTATTGKVVIMNANCNESVIKTNTGDIDVSDFDCEGKLEVSVTTGRVSLTNVNAGSLSSNGDTGDIILNSVLVDDKMLIKRDTGDVGFDKCDAGEVEIITDTGDVKGSFLTEKIIFAETDTGRVDVPKLTSGARCDITTDTGDIKVTIEQ